MLISDETNKISYEMTWKCLRKENLNRETAFLLIAAQNHSQQTNIVKAKIDIMQQIFKHRICADRDEMTYKPK